MLEMILYVLVGNWKKPRSRPNCVKESLTQFKVEVQFPVVKRLVYAKFPSLENSQIFEGL